MRPGSTEGVIGQMSMVEVNPLRARLDEPEALLGGWCTLPTSFAAELVGRSGVDYAVVDMQHGLGSYSDLISMLQAISLAGAVPLVRIPFGDYGLAQRALDAGAMGLIVPMVNNVDLARAAVNACRYPPIGERSFGPIRAKLHLGTDPQWANEQVMCLVQIETREAMSQLDGILDVPGIDGVYVGPADLALSHGLPAGSPTEELTALLSRIVLPGPLQDLCHPHPLRRGLPGEDLARLSHVLHRQRLGLVAYGVFPAGCHCQGAGICRRWGAVLMKVATSRIAMLADRKEATWTRFV